MSRQKEHKLVRIYINQDIIQDDIIILGQEQHHYLINVMRLTINDNIRIFNGHNGEYLAKIHSISKKSFEIIVESQFKSQTDEQSLTLLFAPIKQHRLDIMIEKATELGVTEFIPVKTSRTIIDKINIQKYQKLIIEACEQCERLSIPNIHNIVKLHDLMETICSKDSIIFFANEHEAYTNNIDELARIDKKIYILIGPEGGFTTEEIQYLQQKQSVKSISLGKNILRAETAALKLISLLTQ